MDDGSQKLLDVIDDPSALESFLGLSAAAAGESSSRTTLESLVDSLQQGLLDPNATAGGGASSARHATAGTPQTAPAGSLVLTQQQLQQLQQFQAGNAGGRPQGQAVTFSLPPHSSSAPIASSAPTVLTTSSSSSTHHFVLTPFHHAGGGNGSQPQHPQPITLINPSTQQVSSSVAQPSTSFISASTAGTVSHLTNPNIAIGHGGTILTTSTAGLHVGGAVPSTGMTAIGSSAGGPSMQNLATNSTAGSNIFGASIIPASNSSTGNSVLVGPTGTTVFAPAISSPGSPFSVPTRSPAPHAPPTPSPSPLPLRSPASVSSHHPPSPAPSPYHTQLQSPQQPQQQPQPQQQQPQTNVANTSYILSANAGQNTPQNILKEHFGSLQTHSVSSSQTPSSFVLSTANTTFKTLPSGLAISGAGQFPVMPPGSTAMLQGNHQLVQIIHHTAAPQTSTFPAHTQIITTGPGGTVPLQQAATAVGGPPKPKQPPQILPKPPSGQPTAGTHTKIAANARATASTQHQGIHAQHHTSASAAQVVIGQANPTAVIPTAQTGTLLVNQVIPGIPPGGPLLVQPNPSGSVQLILRSPTPGAQAAASNQGTQHGQQPQQGKSPTPHQQPMFISGATTAQLVHNAGRQQMQQVLRLITAQGPMQLQQIQTPSGPTLIAVPSGPTLSFQQLGPQTPAPAPATVPPQIPPQPPQGPRPSTPQQQQPQPQQPTPAAQPTTSSIIPTVQLHQSAMRPSLTTGTSCAPQQSVSAVIGGHSISVGNANATPTIIHQNHQQHSQQDVSSAQQNPSFPIIRHNQTVLPAQQHQCTGTNTDQTALMKKKPKKKKIKKKKDEEPKLDLANIMKLSGIGEDEDMAIYEPEEAQVAQGAQSPAAIEQAPGNQQPQQPQQSQLIAQLRSPPQIPIQSGSGGTTSLRLALEDGHVVLHHAATPNNPQQPATNILLQNLPSAVGQQQQNVSTGQNQLPALLASGTCGPSTNNHMVLSQLLQQTSPPSLPPHLLPSSNSSTNRSTTSTSPNTTNTVPPQPKDRFTMVQQGAKTGFVKDSFSSGDLPNASISKLDASVSSVPNTTPAAFGIHTKTSGGSLSCPNFRDGFLQPGSNKVDSSTSTCSKPSSTPPPGLILTHDNATNLLLAKSPHQHPCQQDITIKQPQDTVQKQNSATTQTEIIHPNIHLGTKQQQPQQDSIPFISASKPGADSGPTFLGLHPFSNIQGLVSTTGASVPLVTGPVMTSGGGSFGGEQLLIAHHGGMSVLAAPQLIQYLQQAQNAAAPGINIMPQLHLTPNAVNKAIGQGIAFNTQAGTILIGGTPETFGATMNNQHKPSIMTATNNAAATKLLPPHQSSVLLQQLNALSGTGAPSALRRCSSDSNNSSISIGSPPPGGGGSASGATAVIGLINQPVVTQSSPMAASAGPRKNQQSIETQTISLGIPTTTSFQNSFLETIAHSHPNQVLGKLTHVTVAPKTTATTAAVVAAAQAAAAAQAGKKKKPKQTRNTKILPVVPSTNRQCNSTGTSPLQERNFAKPNTVCQGTQHVAQTTSNDTSFYVTSPPFTIGQQTRSCNTSTATTVPPLTSICTVGSTATTTVTTSAMVQPVVSKTTSNHGIQSTTEVATSNSHHAGPPPTSKHHCVASQTVSMQQPQSGLVPHLVPIPPGGNAATPAMSSIIQKVQTIQLTPQNQKHLKAVQLQIQSVQGKRMLTPGDQAVLHRLYEEQQRILLTGKVVPTIPGQHAVGLPLNPDGIPSSLDGKQKIQAEVDMSTANTYLANLLRQQSVVPHQNTQLPVRYPHQVGNRIIPLTPANLPKPAPSSSVATTSTTASTTTTRASISVQCSTPSDGLIQQSVGLATQTIPKLSVVQPIVQSPGPSSTQLNKSSSCEKGTSPLQVQQQVQPIFGSPSTASNSKLQPSFSPPSTAKSCSQSAVVGSKLLVGGGKPQAVVAPVSPSDSTSSRSSPVMVTMAGNVKRPTVTSPIRPTFSRSDFIEQQLKTDQSGACMPDTSTPFQSTSDACKRLIRYHVFNEQLLSQQDLEKADEFFEATAKHLLDKFRQMMNKYRYLLLMESMREVNTSELMMIDRMFVAEEHALLERMKEEECRAKEGPVETAEQQPSSPLPAGVLATVKTEPGLSTAGGTTGSSPGEGLREVRVVVRDVMKNESIKRELEEDRKFTVVKRERLDSPANNRDVHQAYDEWEEIQKELGVYCGPNNNIPASGSTYTPPVKVEEESLPILSGIKAERESVSVNETDKKTSPQRDQVENGQKAASSESPGTKVRSGSCGPRDEGGGTEDDDVEEQDDDDDEEQTTEVMEDVKRTEESSGSGGEKRKEFCDTNVDATMSIGHRKKRHKHSYSPQHDDCADDENDDINAQVQCAINSILNLQRSEDGFDIRPNATVPSCDMGADESSDCEDTRQYESAKPCSARSRHKRNSASCKSAEQQVVNHHEDNADSALDEAVRSILTS